MKAIPTRAARSTIQTLSAIAQGARWPWAASRRGEPWVIQRPDGAMVARVGPAV